MKNSAKKRLQKLDRKFAKTRRRIVNRSDIYMPLQDPRAILDNAMRYTKSDKYGFEYSEKDLRKSMVNYVRHKETTYERDLRYMHRVVPNKYHNEVYKFIKNSSLTMIASEYSFLSDECVRQKRKNNMLTIVN